jgi:heterodisulfide reductase subunit A-like polyferredoxin
MLLSLCVISMLLLVVAVRQFYYLCRQARMSDTGNKLIDADVVIIGAGISGLTAAYTIHSKDPGIRVVVVEAKGKFSITMSLDMSSMEL